MTDPDHLHDPGGKVRLSLPEGVTGGARFSPCGRYRQTLMRDWTPKGDIARAILFVGMNPSVAGADVSDPTCHRELIFSRDWGYTRYLKGNMLDWRATSPRDIPHELEIACSAANLPALLDMAQEAETLVLAYGKLPARFAPAVARVIAALRALDKPLMCLGLNKDGSARHPLYLSKDTPLIPFPDRAM